MENKTEMVIINLTGQLGNQMFQYALGRKFQSLNRTVKYYAGYFADHPNHYFGLCRFPINIPLVDEQTVLSMTDDRHRLIDRIRRKLIGKRAHIISRVGFDSHVYDPSILDTRDAFIDGYWQTEKYFSDIRHILLADFSFPKSENSRNQLVVNEIKNNVSISIHVRRGDYLGGFPVMSQEYYKSAMQYFKNKYRNPVFYVFSNDMEWCKQNIVGDDVKYIDWNTGEDSIFDMWLMTQCKHSIIANSSFSWWGAWLNQNDGQEVISPKIWFDNKPTPDIWCQDWIKM